MCRQVVEVAVIPILKMNNVFENRLSLVRILKSKLLKMSKVGKLIFLTDIGTKKVYFLIHLVKSFSMLSTLLRSSTSIVKPGRYAGSLFVRNYWLFHIILNC